LSNRGVGGRFCDGREWSGEVVGGGSDVGIGSVVESGVGGTWGGGRHGVVLGGDWACKQARREESRVVGGHGEMWADMGRKKVIIGIWVGVIVG